MDPIIEQVKDYYGKQIKSKDDLKSSSCCCNERPSQDIQQILSLIAPEILDKFYGCGSPLPPLLAGTTVLDLGCGTGRDVYIASKLVGEHGKIIGVDMTDEQLVVARKYQDEQARLFGYAKSNVSFLQGYIEDLHSLAIPDRSVDVVISNCVINLSVNKEAVFKEIFRVLKPGGELFFADIFADRRIPSELAQNPLLRGECLGGVMYIEDFRRLMRSCGWAAFGYTSTREVHIDSPEMFNLIGMASFTSRTVRAFKLDDLEDGCEDYGQTACYHGKIPGSPHFFDVDSGLRLYTGKTMPVCGNYASILSKTRYAPFFTVNGNRQKHFGAFGGCSDCSETTDGSCCA